jgi:hypothetical protein
MDERTDSPSTFEEQRIEIEREKLNVEKEGIKFERFKLITTSISVCVPLLALFATVFLGIWSQKQKDTNDFNLKAAEITLNTDNPWVTYNKAQSLRQIFPKILPDDFAKTFNPETIGVDETNSKKELFNLIAAHPEHAKQIIQIWMAIFPGDTWIEDVNKRMEKIK